MLFQPHVRAQGDEGNVVWVLWALGLAEGAEGVIKFHGRT